MKTFYMTRNGWQFQWSFKTGATGTYALGNIKINGIGDLTEVGSVLVKDYMEPSVFDLEDLNDEDDEDASVDDGDNDESAHNDENEHSTSFNEKQRDTGRDDEQSDTGKYIT